MASKNNQKVAPLSAGGSKGFLAGMLKRRRTSSSSIGSRRAKATKIAHAIKDKLTGSIRVFKSERLSVLDICCSLARVPSSEVFLEWDVGVFNLERLSLAFSSLNGSVQLLQLPPNVPGDTDVGDAEEQGDGGTCDKFIGMLPESCREISAKASPLGLVPKLFPHGKIEANARYIGSCFWIWLCIVDDLIEKFSGKEWDNTEPDLIKCFSELDVEAVEFRNSRSEAVLVSLALRSVIDTTEIGDEEDWRASFRGAVLEVIMGFRHERPLLENSRKMSLESWMLVRVITISARPFMVLARASFGLSPSLSALGNPISHIDTPYIGEENAKDMALARVELLVQIITGLQNDIIGWEKDSKTQNPLNAIQILIQRGAKPLVAMSEVIDVHNKMVKHLSSLAESVWLVELAIGQFAPATSGKILTPSDVGLNTSLQLPTVTRKDSVLTQSLSTETENLHRYLELILGFGNGMANWMAVSKRYIA